MEGFMPDTAAPVKCLVWDLDNTLWQGTLLEDPQVLLPDSVRVVVMALDSRGILQSIASKNDYDKAWSRLEELGLAEYFVLPRIGWGRKSDSVIEIAERLNFAHSAIAFIDDQPAERAEVTFHAPEVRCYPADEALMLPGRAEFSPEVVTVDARRRRQMYQANFRREAEKESFTGPDEEFLRSLDLVMRIGRADGEDLSRVEELTLRTSQMNATGVHYSDAVLRGLLTDPDHEVLTITLTDRFGPHGAVGVMLLERHLAADFRRTDRNRMMEIAYRFAGFTDEACGCIAALGTDGTGHRDAAGPGGADIERMHLIPARRSEPATMRLMSPDLASYARG